MNADRRRKTRVEDYLLAVHQLCRDGALATTGEVARIVGVANGTASSMIRELARADLVEHQPYVGACLMGKGDAMLSLVRRRRQLLELFLRRTLDLDDAIAIDEAWTLEPVATDELIQRIDSKLGCPQTDFRGDPILASANNSDGCNDSVVRTNV